MRAGMSALCYKQTHAVQRKTDPRGQLYIRLPTASTRTCASHKSKIGGDQLVRPFATAPIDLGGNQALRIPLSSNCMLGVIRLKASSVTKNDASIAPSCPQNRTAHRVASNERL